MLGLLRTAPVAAALEWSILNPGRVMLKRHLINTGTDKRFVRRNSKGQFNESDDVGRSLSMDRRRKAHNRVESGQGDKGDKAYRSKEADRPAVGDRNAADYVWHAKTNRSFIARCHIQPGNNWLRVQFDSDIGPIERREDASGNPFFIVSDGGASLCLRGAVTVPSETSESQGTITFTPQDEGITEWHWTLTRDGQTYTEEGRGRFRPDKPKPKPATRPRAKAKAKTPGIHKKKPVRNKKLRTVSKKAVRRKTSPNRMKHAGRKRQARPSRSKR